MYKVKEVSSMLVCAEEQKNDQPNADQELQTGNELNNET